MFICARPSSKDWACCHRKCTIYILQWWWHSMSSWMLMSLDRAGWMMTRAKYKIIFFQSQTSAFFHAVAGSDWSLMTHDVLWDAFLTDNFSFVACSDETWMLLAVEGFLCHQQHFQICSCSARVTHGSLDGVNLLTLDAAYAVKRGCHVSDWADLMRMRDGKIPRNVCTISTSVFWLESKLLTFLAKLNRIWWSRRIFFTVKSKIPFQKIKKIWI